MKRDKIINKILAVFFTILSLAWIYPMVMILMNSFKEETTITTSTAFDFVTSENSAGFANYIAALEKQGFLAAFGYSLVITITSVALILVCCSMCAWFIVRVKNRISNILYYLFVFSMVVPFQMLMFTLSNMANTLGFNTPFNICFIYLGFGAGLAVFMFAGFVKTIPLEIEEAATIDGCNPLQTFFHVVLPIMKPTYISVGILETMWVWNDYLLPYLVLDRTKYQTIPILIQYFRGGYDGSNVCLHHDGYCPNCHYVFAVPALHHQWCHFWRGKRLNLNVLQQAIGISERFYHGRNRFKEYKKNLPK